MAIVYNKGQIFELSSFSDHVPISEELKINYGLGYALTCVHITYATIITQTKYNSQSPIYSLQRDSKYLFHYREFIHNFKLTYSFCIHISGNLFPRLQK